MYILIIRTSLTIVFFNIKLSILVDRTQNYYIKPTMKYKLRCMCSIPICIFIY